MTPSMIRPTVYCASPKSRAAMWRARSALLGPTINVVSTWHDNLTLEQDELDAAQCAAGWQQNIIEIVQNADHLLVYAEQRDRPEGTFVEIGAALSRLLSVHLVGNYKWGSWKHHPLVQVHPTLVVAVGHINGSLTE
jgi:hypothetical protein